MFFIKFMYVKICVSFTVTAGHRSWCEMKTVFQFLSTNNIQIMPGLEGDLEEWQTQEVNVTRGKAEGDIDLEGLPFLKEL